MRRKLDIKAQKISLNIGFLSIILCFKISKLGFDRESVPDVKKTVKQTLTVKMIPKKRSKSFSLSSTLTF